MGKGYWGDLWDAVGQLTGARAAHPDDLRPIYEEAAKAGVLEPGRTRSFALPPNRQAGEMLGRKLAGPEYIEASVRRHATSPTGIGFQIQKRLPEGASTEDMVAEAMRLQGESLQDPNTYVSMITPEAMLAHRAYGDKFGEVLRASLLSADRPKLLKGQPITAALSRERITHNLKEPIAVFRTPGLGFQSQAPDGSKQTGLGFMHPGLEVMAWPRAMDQSVVPSHELSHAIYHRSGAGGGGKQPLFTSSPQLSGSREQYMSTWPEAQAEAGVLKRMHYMNTGKVIANQADAQDFMNLLLSDAPKVTDPAPNAKFGAPAVIGKPIQDYNSEMRIWSDMMKKASQEDRDKFIELLPKVIRNDKPSTVVNA